MHVEEFNDDRIYSKFSSKSTCHTINNNNSVIDKLSRKYRGVVGLMCQNCNNVIYRRLYVTIKSSIEDDKEHSNDNLKDNQYIYANLPFSIKKSICENCKCKDVNMIQLDPNIAETISVLNKKGYSTKFCCEGHGYGGAYVYFNNDEIMKKMFDTIFNTLPSSWYLDLNNFKESKIIIRSDENEYPNNILELNEWADSLPDVISSQKILFNKIIKEELMDEY